jgi:hypothetical protein
MKQRRRLAAAITLIALGGWFLAVEIVPGLRAFAYGRDTWPLPIIGIGAFLAVLALVTWTPSTFVPASVVAGVGGLLYWQNSTGHWGSWAYAWSLIPGFVGVGMVLAGALDRDRGAVIGGGWTVLISLLLFGIFGSWLGNLSLLGKFWPVLLIALGIVLLFGAILRRR